MFRSVWSSACNASTFWLFGIRSNLCQCSSSRIFLVVAHFADVNSHFQKMRAHSRLVLRWVLFYKHCILLCCFLERKTDVPYIGVPYIKVLHRMSDLRGSSPHLWMSLCSEQRWPIPVGCHRTISICCIKLKPDARARKSDRINSRDTCQRDFKWWQMAPQYELLQSVIHLVSYAV